VLCDNNASRPAAVQAYSGAVTWPARGPAPKGRGIRNLIYAVWLAAPPVRTCSYHRLLPRGCMALIENVVESNLLTAAAIGAVALVLPKVMPDLSPPLRSMVKGGISLFLESESEAEGGIVERLAGTALKGVLESLSAPGDSAGQQQQARSAINHFKRTARRRARHYACNDDDRTARYRRHIHALRRGLDRARQQRTGDDAEEIEKLMATLDSA
jgi:hypothetical protein